MTGPLAGVTPSFVLISIDALRADHVGAYGYGRATTPNIDRFAAGAARFTRVYCTLPRSARSIGSIWTGRYPSHMAWGNDIQYPELLDENVTLATTLGAAGYVSAAFINGDYFHRTPGFFAGFTESHAPHDSGRTVWKSDPYAEAAELTRYLAERAADPRPFLAWTHLMEPHEPYRHWTTPRDRADRDGPLRRGGGARRRRGRPHAGRGGRAARRGAPSSSPSSPTTARPSASTASTSTRRICTTSRCACRSSSAAPGSRRASAPRWCR